MPSVVYAKRLKIVSVALIRFSRVAASHSIRVFRTALRPFDTALLQCARQGEAGPDASRRVVVTVPASQGPPAGAEVRDELENAKVVGFSASHSAGAAMTQLMLQVSVRRVTLNGIVRN